MATSNVAILNEHLSQRPEPLREDLAGYILEHLDEIERDMGLPDDDFELSDELKQELLRREAAALADPHKGSTWAEVKERILNSR